MKKSLYIALLATSVWAGDSDLSSLLAETTELATKTKLNIDYIPGTISVISGEEMKALGVTNLAEPNAFDMIAGMDTQSNSLRGTGADYGAYGQAIKWMVNGKEFSSEIATATTWTSPRTAFAIPIDMVDRVEVIRGPGSSLYGGNAVFGIVNIVTKKGYNGLFVGAEAAGGGKFGESGGGLVNLKGENYSIDASLGAYQTDGSNLNVGKNGNYYSWAWPGTQNPGYGPGQLPNGNSGLSAMVDANFYGYKAWAYRYQLNSAQGAFGLWVPNFPLPQSGANYTVQNAKTHLGVEKTFDITNNFKLTPQIWYLQTQNNANNFYYLSSSQTASGMDGSTSRHYNEGRKTAQLDGEYKLENHDINAGLFYQLTNNVQDQKYSNAWSANGAMVYSGTFWPMPKMGLINRAGYAQDQWSVTDSATITYGLRYDSYAPQAMNKFQAVSPRIAGVWAMDDNNIIKAQYSKAFRPPTMSDLADNPNLQPESVDTFELGYIYKNAKQSIKPTIFESRIYNMLSYNGYTGSAENRNFCSKIDGLEIEYKLMHELFSLNANGTAYATNSPAHTMYDSGSGAWVTPSQKFDLSPSYMANIWVTLQPLSDYPTTIWLHYLSSELKTNYPTTYSGKPISLNNDSLPPQNYVNITQQFKGLINKLELSVGVRDVFNTTMQSLRMPLSFYNENDQHNSQGVPYMGRTFWLNAAYKF